MQAQMFGKYKRKCLENTSSHVWKIQAHMFGKYKRTCLENQESKKKFNSLRPILFELSQKKRQLLFKCNVAKR